MQFSYQAVDSKGVKQKGLIEANSEKEVLDYLRTNKFTPLSVKNLDDLKKSSFQFFKKTSNEDLVIFTRQLSSMILTGLTLIESLSILKQQTIKPAMKNLLGDLVASISEGKTFSDALAEHRDVFSEVYIALIRAAEAGGLLDKVLSRLADNLEKSADLKKRVKSALFYPMIVVTGVVVVIGVMNVVVIPQLGKLYENLNLELPLTTRIVLWVSGATKVLAPFGIAAAFGLFFLYKRMKTTETGLKTIDKIKLNAPVFGSIIKLSLLDELTRTLSLLISAGTSIIEALNITANVATNVWYKDAIKNAATLVEKGVPISTAFEYQNIFPPIVIQMTRVGETTGKIDDSLYKLSDYFERDLDIKVRTLTTSIEPILIIVLGVGVAFLILSVITPIYGLISQIQ